MFFEISTDCLFVKTATEKPRRGDTDPDESSSDDGNDEDEDGGKLRDSDLESEMDLEEKNEESGEEEEEEEEEEDSGEGKWTNVKTYSKSGRPPLITIPPLNSQKSTRDQDPDYRPDSD